METIPCCPASAVIQAALLAHWSPPADMLTGDEGIGVPYVLPFDPRDLAHIQNGRGLDIYHAAYEFLGRMFPS